MCWRLCSWLMDLVLGQVMDHWGSDLRERLISWGAGNLMVPLRGWWVRGSRSLGACCWKRRLRHCPMLWVYASQHSTMYGLSYRVLPNHRPTVTEPSGVAQISKTEKQNITPQIVSLRYLIWGTEHVVCPLNPSPTVLAEYADIRRSR